MSILWYMKKYNTEKIKCNCGSEFVKSKKYSHNKTKKHLNYINQN